MQAEELRGLNPEDFEKELIDQSILNAKNQNSRDTYDERNNP